MSSTARDPLTGRLLYPVEVVVSLDGGLMPRHVSCGSWSAALGYLDSPDFRSIRDHARLVTITVAEDTR